MLRKPLFVNVREKTSTIKKTLILCFITLAITPQILTIIFQVEDWPLTHAPMFAHYVGAETPLYKFNFKWRIKGSADLLHMKWFGTRDPALLRLFFLNFYLKQGVFVKFTGEVDNPKDFAERLTLFFNKFDSKIKINAPRLHGNIEEIVLEVSKVNDAGEVLETHLIGNYSFTEKRFNHAWTN